MFAPVPLSVSADYSDYLNTYPPIWLPSLNGFKIMREKVHANVLT